MKYDFDLLHCDRWDEVGDYDMPAIIEYILKTTGQPKLIYVGHSLGPAYAFIALNNHPELNNKIEMMFALAPVVSSRYFTELLPVVSKNIKNLKVTSTTKTQSS